jgi:hypothetical protein
MMFLFSIIIVKRLFFDIEQNYNRLFYHLGVIALYYVVL